MSAFLPRHPAPTCKIRDIAYLRFARRELPRAQAYFTDFGLRLSARQGDRLYLRGLSAAHHCVIIEKAEKDAFLGVGLFASAASDLDALASALGGCVETNPEPGGGTVLRLTDPAGMRVDVLYGQAELATLPHRPPRVLNSPLEKRRVNTPQPALPRRAEVFRIGHCVLQRQEFARNANWYVEHFGLIASDVLILPQSREPVLAFLRCDRGEIPADHHTLVVAAGIEDAYEHAAFEVLDLDALALGGEWLQLRGWTRTWGVGRHVLGSQLFDYHRDSAGFMVEHFTDGDVFDARYPTRWHLMDKAGLYAWGPDVPPHFVDTAPNLRRIAQALRGLRTRDGFSLQRLLAVKSAMERPARPWQP